jgi:hypothetical protein
VITYKRACLSSAKSTRPTAHDAALIAYCDCTAKKLQARWSFEEFSKQEALLVASMGATPPAELNEVMQACEVAWLPAPAAPR